MINKILRRIPAAKGYPRPTGPLIPLEDLKPGDILLSRGHTDVANAIVAADGGSYSHAALWSGTGVIEAALAGTGEHDFTGDRDVYRHRALGPSAATSIIGLARQQLGRQYPYSELVLLAALFAVGICPQRPILHAALDALGGRTARRLEEWLDRTLAGQAPRICTELVALSYFTAEDGRYALRILPRKYRPTNEQPRNAQALGQQGREGEEREQQERGPQGATEQGGLGEPSSEDAGRDLASLAVTCTNLLARCRQRDIVAAAGPATPMADAQGEVPRQGLHELATRQGLHELATRQGLHELATGARLETRKLLAGPIALDAVSGARFGVVTPGDLQFSPSLEYVGQVTAEQTR